MDRKCFLIFFLPFFILQSLVAQEVEDSNFIYKWFDGVVGVENSGLLNGIEYIDQHITVNEQQKFLKGIYFTPGSVVYDGQPYYNVEMKYNVFEDLLLLPGTGSKPLQLHKSRVQEFSLHGIKFLNVMADTSGIVQGFYELVLEKENLRLLKKHTKKSKKFLDRSFLYFEFYEDSPRYAIAHRGKYYSVNSRREVMRAFPNHVREIRKFYRERRKQAKDNPDLFMNELALRLVELSSSNTLPE